MATWAESNGGGLLAGIGSQNNNAPRSIDNIATLGLIQGNNEFTRQGGNNVGLQALQGLSGLAGMHQQEQQQNAIKSFNQAHAQAWKTGDNSVLRDFAAANPAFVAQAQQAVAGLDEQQRNDMGVLAMGANTALAQGPEAFGKYVQQNADGLRRVGADPDWILQTGMQNPDQLSHLTTTLAMGALGPEKAFAVKDKMEGREIDRGKLAEQMRSNQAGESLQARGQDIQVRGQNISAQNAELDRDIRRSEMQQKALDRQLQRETDSLKRTELEQKIAANEQSFAAAKEKKRVNEISDKKRLDSVTDGYTELAGKANELLNNESLWRATGTVGKLWNLPGSAAADIDAAIASLKHQVGMQTLTGMKELSANGASGLGNASNKEYEGLQNSLASLDTKQSPAAFRANLKRIVGYSNRSKGRLTSAFHESYPDYKAPDTQQQQGNNFSNLWGE